jgi:hypothetical protein
MSDADEVIDVDAVEAEGQTSAEDHARMRGDFLEGDDEGDETAKAEPDEKEADEAAEDSEDTGESRKGQNISIPKARFDEVNARMKQAEQELEALRAERGKADEESHSDDNKQQPDTDLKALAKEIAAKTRQSMDALIDGDEELYDKLSGEIEDARARQVEIRAGEIAERTVNETKTKAEAQKEYDTAVQHAEKIAATYPFLGEGGDAEAIETFGLLRDNMLAKGATRLEAMDSALAKVAKMYGYEVADTDSSRSAKAGAGNANLLRKEAMAARQPPRMGGVGNRAAGSTAPTKVEQMSDDEFSKLTQREKKALRGDNL